MRILQLGKFYPIRGGVEKVMWDLTDGLTERGVDCDMLCAILPGNADQLQTCGVHHGSVELQRVEFNEHGDCICVRAAGKVAATMISPAMVRWLRRHRKDYDIIHIHHPDPMACLALRLSGFKGKVVLHWHSDILKQKGLLKLYQPLQRWLIGRADKIVGTTPLYVRNSPFLQDVQDKVTSMPIGVRDTMRDRNAGVNTLSDPITVFSLGRLVEYKGFEHLIDSAKYLPDNYRIVIGGGGPLRNELQSRIDEAGLGNKVRLLGYLTDEQTHEWFNRCDVFALSSVMKTEAFGIVQIEAMSCGKPVIATRIKDSGVSWVNEDGVSGKNAEPGDPASLAAAILFVTSDQGRYESFCNDARKRYEQNFTIGKMIDRCLGIYGYETE